MFSPSVTQYSTSVGYGADTITVTATPTLSGSTVAIGAVRDGTAIRISASAIDGNTITLGLHNTGGTGGATGIAPPFTLTFTAREPGVTGPTYTINITN